MTSRATTLTVPTRYCGPPRSGNGGWVAGAVAGLLETDGPVTVSLRRPPPLDVAMAVTRTEGGVAVSQDGEEVASASPAAVDPAPAAAVDPATARAAEAAYAGLTHHPFPTCFACGTGREPGDGLRIFAGPVAPGVVAATWTPDPDADLATTWASLDCSSAWAAEIGGRAMVLGRMTALVDRLPRPGVEHVVVGEARTEEGRKIGTATSLYDDAGELVGAAEHVWITVDPETFGYTAS